VEAEDREAGEVEMAMDQAHNVKEDVGVVDSLKLY
jgi:hypothetical protein